MRHLAFTAKNYSTAVSTAATIQLLYAYPNGDYFECDQDPNELRDGFIASPLFQLDNGMATPTDRPGLGVDVDEQALKRWLVR
jgi:D-arabinonate dehydratase/D-galactarolactone cycloisomerase